MKLKIIGVLSCLFVCFHAITAEKFCSSGSLDDLKLIDLLRKSKIDEGCKKEARKVFEKNYKQTTFLAVKSIDSDWNAIDETSGGKNVVSLRSENVINGVLSTFGDFIEKLAVELSVGDKTANLINEKGAESLRQLFLTNFKSSVVDQWKNTFKNVKTLSVATLANFEPKDKDKKFSAFFPNVEKLMVQKILDWKFIEGKFDNAKTVEFTDGSVQIGDVNEAIKNFFTNNIQIERLIVSTPTLKFLTYATNLTNLKTLELQSLTPTFSNHVGEDLSFNSVKKLKIVAENGNVIPNGIVFDKLEDFTLELPNEQLSDKWIEFIEKKVNKKSTRFTIQNPNLSKDQFLAIPDKLPELKFVYISNNEVVDKTTAEPIEKFVEKSKQLKTLVIDTEMEKSEQKKVQDALKKAKWNVEITSLDETKDRINLNIRNSANGFASLMNQAVLISIATVAFAFAKLF